MADLQIFDCDQGSAAWFDCRKGIPTASEFHTVLAKGRDGGASLTRRAYLMRLAGEILTEASAETYASAAMERGKVMEEEAREAYAFAHEVVPQRVGFMRLGAMGCSPDSLIGVDGGVEFKTAQPNVLIELLLKDEFPPAHRAQVQGTLMITGRDWWDLNVYWPKLPRFEKRATPDREYIANLRGEIDRFNDELAVLVERVRRYGQPEAVAA